MTIEIFIIMLVAFSALSGLLTEAVKNAAKNINKEISPNITALIDAIVIGGGGSVAVFVWLGITFTLTNVIAIIAMTLAVWVGSMTSYDKVIQTIKQISIG